MSPIAFAFNFKKRGVMKLVMGRLNGEVLRNLHEEGLANCSAVSAAVAYAHGGHEFFEKCASKAIPLTYFGLLDETMAVPIPVLEFFLKRNATFQCRLVRGHFHSKVIWWHDHGVYIGSANLTNAAWYNNVESGTFFTSDEIEELGFRRDLENLFSYLHQQSIAISKELVDRLKRFRDSFSSQSARVESAARKKFEEDFSGIPAHLGLDILPDESYKQEKKKMEFVREWHETLDLLRKLAREFEKLDSEPTWVDRSESLAVRFDQFLQAYYYTRVCGGADEGRSIDKVRREHEQNVGRQLTALREAALWWKQLEEAPSGEDNFISNVAPRTRALLKKDQLVAMTESKLREALGGVHAFSTYARQLKNSKLGLPPEASRNTEERKALLAGVIWRSKTETGRSIADMLEFVIYGDAAGAVEDRIWAALEEPEWRLQFIGRSTLGEIVGWARPDEYPPRNNRTNKALVSLGYDIQLFANE